jgi:diguanylate cyclase (GGDEF)-like protein
LTLTGADGKLICTPPHEGIAAMKLQALTAERILSSFSRVPALGTPDGVAVACLEALRALVSGPLRLVLPARPISVEHGASAEGLVPLLRFRVGPHEGMLLGDPDNRIDARSAPLVAEQLVGIWEVQVERERQLLELDRLRFQLASLQQVTRSLATARGVEETERIILDSVAEVFFAWWAGLYRLHGEVYRLRAARQLRSEQLDAELPRSAVTALHSGEAAPVVPDSALEIHRFSPPGLAVVAQLPVGDGDDEILLLGPRMTDMPYETHDLALLRSLADASVVSLRNAHLLDRLRAQATSDPLTGCENRRGFDERLTSEFGRALRYGRPLTLMLLDIDHFKEVNDRHGHEAGDDALRRLARALRSALRSNDTAARYGGEEFALLLPETPKQEGAQVAERIREMVTTLPQEAPHEIHITVSLGVAGFPEDAGDAGELMRAADRALYQAKSAGRNRVCIA